jgi:type I restriction enzyme S subunit
MIKYDTYKDSGIDWLREIPQHWSTDRLKNIFSFNTGLSITKKNLKDKGVPCVNYGEIHSKYGFEVNPNIHPLKCVDSSYLETKKKALLKKGDFVFSDTSEDIEGSGNFTYLNSHIETFAGYHTIVARLKQEHHFLFVAFLLDSLSFRTQFQSNVAGIKVYSITQGLLNKLSFLIPPLNEQAQIATYLDKKTNGIDRKIELLSKKISTYKELRKSIINETVINGLDEKTKWQTCRLKDIGYIFSGLSGKSGDDFNQDNNENNRGFIPFTNIANNTYLDKNHLGKVVIKPTEKQNQVKKDDLFFLMSSEGYEDIGKSAVLKDEISETYLNSFCKGFRITKENISAYFLNYLLLSSTYREKMIVQGKGFTRINLKIEKVNNFSISIPTTLEEQKAITNYLDEKTSKIDAIVNNIENQIDHLKELRKALINDVVTGKIKVVEQV